MLGSTHRLTDPHKPHNSLYIIDSTGEIVDRYNKRFCASDRTGLTGDLAHYSPGDHFTVFDIRGIRCGAAICHDYRYPELYREYKRLDVQLMFHSYHAAHVSPETMAQRHAEIGVERQSLNPGLTYPGITMPAGMTAAAASNHVWISCPNSSAPESCWGAFFVRADSVTTGRLPRNRAGSSSLRWTPPKTCTTPRTNGASTRWPGSSTAVPWSATSGPPTEPRCEAPSCQRGSVLLVSARAARRRGRWSRPSSAGGSWPPGRSRSTPPGAPSRSPRWDRPH